LREGVRLLRNGVRLLAKGLYSFAFGSLAPWAGIKNEGLLGSDRMTRILEQRLLLGVRRESLDPADPQSHCPSIGSIRLMQANPRS
jgi:hypothetical protein